MVPVGVVPMLSVPLIEPDVVLMVPLVLVPLVVPMVPPVLVPIVPLVLVPEVVPIPVVVPAVVPLVVRVPAVVPLVPMPVVVPLVLMPEVVVWANAALLKPKANNVATNILAVFMGSRLKVRKGWRLFEIMPLGTTSLRPTDWLRLQKVDILS